MPKSHKMSKGRERFWFATLPFSFFGGGAADRQHGKTIKDSLRLGVVSSTS